MTATPEQREVKIHGLSDSSMYRTDFKHSNTEQGERGRLGEVLEGTMTAFGIFTVSVLLGATVVGIAVGIFAGYIGDGFLGWLAGGCAFAPMFLIVGRVWAKSEMSEAGKGF